MSHIHHAWVTVSVIVGLAFLSVPAIRIFHASAVSAIRPSPQLQLKPWHCWLQSTRRLLNDWISTFVHSGCGCSAPATAALTSMVVGYCVFRAVRSFKTLLACEVLCRSGHCSHKLHRKNVSGQGPGNLGYRPIGVLNGGSTISRPLPVLIDKAVDKGMEMVTIITRASFVLGSSVTLNNLYRLLTCYTSTNKN